MAGDDLLIEVENVSKRFCRRLRQSLRYGVTDMLRELVTGRRPATTLRSGEFWAVREVSLRVRRGEALGLVGRNGAGKTTLLRMIAGLVRPDTGVVRTRGRLVPLLALGAGFNPVLTGRENIRVNMSILGVPPREIRRRLDEVIAFAEIDSAVDAPVRSYSSGMTARLGFACAIHTDPDVLLIDEVLAVGDMAFRGKCYRKLAELRKKGTAFILVSHSTTTILSQCDQAVYLVGGEMRLAGPTQEVMQRYEVDLQARGEGVVTTGRLELPSRGEEHALTIRDVSLRDEQDRPVREIQSGKPAALALTCDVLRPLKEVGVSAVVRDLSEDGTRILVLESARDGVLFDPVAGQVTFRLEMPSCAMRPGLYSFKLYLVGHPGFELYDAVESFLVRVRGDGAMTGCQFYQAREWVFHQDRGGVRDDSRLREVAP